MNTLDWMFPMADPARPDGYTDLMDIDRRRLALDAEMQADLDSVNRRTEVSPGLVLHADALRARRRAGERRRLARLDQAACLFLAVEGVLIP